MTNEELMELEKELRSLLKGEFSNLSLSFNDLTAPNYCSVGKYIAEYGEDNSPYDWVSSEERTKAIEHNSMWVLHWYPDTPVGFISIAASSLPALFEYLRK